MTSPTLSLLIDDETRRISVTAQMLEEAKEILDGMDRDMDKGWQLGKIFYSKPNRIQRCQIAANRLLTALHTQNQASATLMAAYILSRLHGVRTVSLDTSGESEATSFYDADNALIS